MTKYYVRKPLKVAAFRYGFDELPEWFLSTPLITHGAGSSFDCILITNRRGKMRAIPGDYIILDHTGEIYSCRPDIFESTYQPAIDLIEEDFI